MAVSSQFGTPQQCASMLSQARLEPRTTGASHTKTKRPSRDSRRPNIHRFMTLIRCIYLQTKKYCRNMDYIMVCLNQNNSGIRKDVELKREIYYENGDLECC